MLGRIALWAACFVGLSGVSAAQNSRHVLLPEGVTELRTLEQNWSDAESNWFYNAPQGSRLLPYEWFLHLEQPQSEEPFLDAGHIRGLGYVPRAAAADNPDGLPIGFTRDADYEDGTSAVGMTCAACHTGLIEYEGKAFLIDGGPTLGDMERLLKRLSAALHETADDDLKFGRFAAAVLNASDADAARAALRERLREVAAERDGYNSRNLPANGGTPFGPGRVDAFGAIFNEVSATFLNIAENARPADAPVSYPCLWDAPQHDFVQWNGAAENRVSKLGELMFGTDQVGALGRNSGEVLGVFGHAIVPEHEAIIPQNYRSTVKKGNLLKLEQSLKRLWSPEWPDEFGTLDADRRDRGAVIYQQRCQNCHALIDRDDPSRTVTAVLASVDTDPTMIGNFLERRGKTGRLEGRRQTLLKRDRFDAEAPVAMILKHLVERVILRDLLSDDSARLLANAPAELKDSLNPGYESTAFVQWDDEVLAARLSSLVSDAQGNVESLTGAEESVGEEKRQLMFEAVGARAIDVTSADSIRSALPGVKRLVSKGAAHSGLESVPAADPGTATVTIAYKARSLNGVWATAPYLHNGSVPTLAALLTPPAERKPFHVGSRRFDPAGVGYVSDPGHPAFDPGKDGNSNQGHDFGTDLTADQKQDLIEYLKSL